MVIETPIETGRPEVDDLGEVLAALAGWQRDGGSVPLHPGDVGWFWRFGPSTTAAALRTWRRAGRLLAVGLLDGPRLLRLAVAPGVEDDAALARRLAADVVEPGRGVLPDGEAAVEARSGGALADRLLELGWELGEAWTPLRRDLAGPVEDPGLRIEVVAAERAQERVEVHRAAFPRATFTVGRWRAMAAGPAYADARCLLGLDDRGVAVAAVTVWSAGPGRPGLLEPMGVHRDHRGRGHGRAMCRAAADVLRQLGASSAVVATPSGNAGAVATYASAGFRRLPEVHDLCRRAPRPSRA